MLKIKKTIVKTPRIESSSVEDKCNLPIANLSETFLWMHVSNITFYSLL